MRFHVVGVGSIGSLISHHLRLALPPTHSIGIIHKDAHGASSMFRSQCSIRVERNGVSSVSKGFIPQVAPNHMSREGTKLQQKIISRQTSKVPTKEDNTTLERVKETHSTDESRDSLEEDKIQSLIVCTKAQQTLHAIRQLQPRLAPNCTITLLQNGMGVYEQLVARLWPDHYDRPHFILSSLNHGVFQRGKFDVIHTGIGTLEFGIVPDVNSRNFEASLSTAGGLSLDDITSSNDPELEHYHSLRQTIAALLLLSEPLNASWKPMGHVQTTLRRKLVVNSVINPLTALMGCRNGEIFSTPHAHKIMSRVCSEASNVFSKEIERETARYLEDMDHKGVDSNTLPIGRVPRELGREALEQECLAVAQKTGGNISSMLADIRNGRPTEIEYLNDHLISMGQAHQVGTPTIAMLSSLIKMRENIPLDSLLT